MWTKLKLSCIRKCLSIYKTLLTGTPRSRMKFKCPFHLVSSINFVNLLSCIVEIMAFSCSLSQLLLRVQQGQEPAGDGELAWPRLQAFEARDVWPRLHESCHFQLGGGPRHGLRLPAPTGRQGSISWEISPHQRRQLAKDFRNKGQNLSLTWHRMKNIILVSSYCRIL